jgi:uncharacterized protein HemY
MKKPIKKLSERVKEKLIARGLYDKTPDTNIEILNKTMVDHITDKLEDSNVSTLQKSPLIKAFEKNKKKHKEKPIKTSLLLCSTRF